MDAGEVEGHDSFRDFGSRFFVVVVTRTAVGMTAFYVVGRFADEPIWDDACVGFFWAWGIVQAGFDEGDEVGGADVVVVTVW